MSPTSYYKLGNDPSEPIPCDDVVAWAKWYGDANRIVAKTMVQGFTILTIFLGIDQNYIYKKEDAPILWETMVFKDGENGRDCYSEQYCTYSAAIAGHFEIVRQTLPNIELIREISE